MPQLSKFDTDTDFSAQELRNEDHSIFERGKGNVVSAEVNLALFEIFRVVAYAEIVQLSLSLACNDQWRRWQVDPACVQSTIRWQGPFFCNGPRLQGGCQEGDVNATWLSKVELWRVWSSPLSLRSFWTFLIVYSASVTASLKTMTWPMCSIMRKSLVHDLLCMVWDEMSWSTEHPAAAFRARGTPRESDSSSLIHWILKGLDQLSCVWMRLWVLNRAEDGACVLSMTFGRYVNLCMSCHRFSI